MKQFTKTLGIALLGALIALGISDFKDSKSKETKNTISYSEALPTPGQFAIYNTPEGELPSLLREWGFKDFLKQFNKISEKLLKLTNNFI